MFGSFKLLVDLLKIKQYYKNVLVFLPLIFVAQLFNSNAFLRVFWGFISLCAVSSAGYIFNDIIDKNVDKHHPEKKSRPIASGKIGLEVAISTAGILLIIALMIAVLLNIYFVIVVLVLFLSTLMYSLFFKKMFFIDIISISVNFVLRPLSGVFIVFPKEIVRISPWLILVPFFLSIFLAAAKRRSNSLFLGNKSAKHNKLLQKYTEKKTAFLFSASTIILIVTYSLFAIFSDFPLLVLTIPVMVYAIFYFYKKVEKGSVIGRDIIYAFKDKMLMGLLFLWSLMTFFIIYVIHI